MDKIKVRVRKGLGMEWEVDGYVIGSDFSTMLAVVKSLPGATWDSSSKTWIVDAGTDIQKKLDAKRKTSLRFVDEAGLREIMGTEKAADYARRAAEEREREAKREAERKQQAAAHVQARESRVKVAVGEFKVGDMLDGRRISGFGQSWTETDLGDWGRHGIRYDETCDRCHHLGEVDNETGLCRRCGADGETITVCYAYRD